jgi:alpha-ketoglutarate-dependent taurine dioxygenase
MEIQTFTENVGLLISPDKGERLLDLDLEPIENAIRSHGAVYFQGFNADIDTFEKFTNQLSEDYMDNMGSGSYRDTVNVGSDATIQNVAYIYGVAKQRTFALPLHSDRSYVKSMPEIMCFGCAHPADEDGQTTLADGVRIYAAFSEATRKFLDENPIKYMRYYSAEEWPVLFRTSVPADVEAYCKLNDLAFSLDADNGITTEYVTTAVPLTKWGKEKAFVNSIPIQIWQERGLGRAYPRVRMADGSEIPEAILAEINEVGEQLTENLPWQPGDVAIVDNTRMMHGRRAFKDQAREIYVRMCRSVAW